MTDKIDEFFEREREAVPFLAPPAGRFEELQTVARRRRNRNTTAVSAAAAVVLAVVGTGVVLGAQSLAGHSNNNLAGPSTKSTTRLSASAAATPAQQQVPVPQGFLVSSMSFSSGSQGWAVGRAACASSECATVIGTTDVAATWHLVKQLTAAETAQAGLTSGAASVRFTSARDGWIVGSSEVLSTHDGGDSWTPVSALKGAQVQALEAPNSRLVYASGADGSTLWVNSNPAGDDWRPAGGLDLTAGGTDSISTSNILVAVARTRGSWTNVRVNDDRGSGTWTSVSLPCTQFDSGPAPLYQLVDDSHATIVCGNGTTYWTDVYGRHPKIETKAEPRGDGTAFAATSISVSAYVTVASYRGGGLVVSPDHGKHWTEALRGSFSYVGMTDASQGFALTDPASSQFWLTLDAGVTWQARSFS